MIFRLILAAAALAAFSSGALSADTGRAGGKQAKRHAPECCEIYRYVYAGAWYGSKRWLPQLGGRLSATKCKPPAAIGFLASSPVNSQSASSISTLGRIKVPATSMGLTPRPRATTSGKTKTAATTIFSRAA